MSGDSSTAITRKGAAGTGFLRTLLALYSSWRTLLTNVVFFGVYYILFYELILHTNGGYFLLTIPYSLLLLVVLASSAQATVAIAYLRLALRRRSIAGVAQSPVGVALGAFVATCSCNLPLLGPLMYFIGLNSLEVSGVLSFLAAYQEAIVEAIVVIDALSIYYYLRQIARAGPGAPRRKAVNNSVN